MEITIKSGAELSKLLDVLANDIVDANIYYQLFTGLDASIPHYADERNLSNTFWWLALRAIKEAYLLRLCRIFDQNEKSLNLVNLLDTIKSNIHFFQEPHFRERLKDNAFVDSLAEGVVIPPMSELQADMEFSSSNNLIVKKLMLWRHNVYAHTGKPTASGILEENPISKEEIEQLLDKCFSISNKYMSMYKASSWSRQIVGHDDYLSLLKFLRIGLEQNEANIQKELNSWNNK